MSEALKVLGQANPSATTLTALYTVPGATSVTVSTLVVANRGGAKIKFRVSVAIGGAANSNEQYLFYDVQLLANSTFTATIGMTLAATDEVRVYTDIATVSFNLFGVEVT